MKYTCKNCQDFSQIMHENIFNNINLKTYNNKNDNVNAEVSNCNRNNVNISSVKNENRENDISIHEFENNNHDTCVQFLNFSEQIVIDDVNDRIFSTEMSANDIIHFVHNQVSQCNNIHSRMWSTLLNYYQTTST